MNMKNYPFTIENDSMRNPFVGIPSFLMAPMNFDLEHLDADIAVIGMPYDMGTSVNTGARFGPRGVREASTYNAYAHEGWYDPIRREHFLGAPWRIVDCGDIDVLHTEQKRSFQNCEMAVRKILERKAIPFVIGGDHAITTPILRAFDCYQELCVIQFDAHLDFTKNPHGILEGPGSPMRRASEMAHVGKIMQIGIRGIGSSQESDFLDAEEYGNIILTSREVRQKGIEHVISQIPDADNYYITVDIDGLDPSIAIGTGSPVPFGLLYEEVSAVIEAVAFKGNLAGMDVVEISPPCDIHNMTSMYGAQLMLDAMSFLTKAKELRTKSDSTQNSCSQL
ncbi:MAG: agmatinase [Clostridiales bacterium]|nr:agmatinase [Clostridiales bacterium]